jgi:hypothetical protein
MEDYFHPMIAALKPSELEADVNGVLDAAWHRPQYIKRRGRLLVITKARLEPDKGDAPLSPWEQRAAVIESFYDPNKAW